MDAGGGQIATSASFEFQTPGARRFGKTGGGLIATCTGFEFRHPGRGGGRGGD